MKLIKLILSLTFIWLMLNITAYAEETAEEITLKCKIHSEHNPEQIKAVYDGKTSTAWSGADGTVIEIESDVPIGGLYTEWNAAPESWAAVLPDGTCLTSATGFLHDYIEINRTDITNLKIYVYGSSIELSELYIFSLGAAQPFVQQWEEPLAKADMLLIPTHADDEHLFFGGTMPMYAGELEKKVQVAYLTKHEVNRTHELLNGLWTVGIRNYPVISEFTDQYADSLEAAKKLYDENEILEYQVMLIRRFKPDVIIGHDLNGEYGHGVHMLNAETLCKALDISTNSEQFPGSAKEYGIWNVQKCYLHMYPENPIVMDWSTPLNKFSGKTAFDMAVTGFACHKSQQEFFKVSNSLGYMGCRSFGLYRTTVGQDTGKNDFFENIVQTLLPEPEQETDETPDNADETQPKPEAPDMSGTDGSTTDVVIGSENTIKIIYMLMALGALLAVILTIKTLKNRI